MKGNAHLLLFLIFISNFMKSLNLAASSSVLLCLQSAFKWSKILPLITPDSHTLSNLMMMMRVMVSEGDDDDNPGLEHLDQLGDWKALCVLLINQLLKNS